MENFISINQILEAEIERDNPGDKRIYKLKPPQQSKKT